MDDKTLYDKVGKLLTAFETLEPIQPSAEWEQSLLSKVNQGRNKKSGLINRVGVAVVVLLVINVTLVVKMMQPVHESTIHQDPSFQVISNALFINPLPVNH